MHLHADVPRTHALTDLWAVARAAGAPASLEVEAASVLSPYAVEVRYAGLDRITEAEATEALRLARGVLAWASRFIAE
jgi:HEPN domain-containing protein